MRRMMVGMWVFAIVTGLSYGKVMAYNPVDLAKLQQTNSCVNCSLSSVQLFEVNLTNADLRGADLSNADLYHSNLTGANLTGANLTKAGLVANLTGANLTGANLTRAVLDWANLSNANLSRVNLTQATLVDANLSGAVLFSTCEPCPMCSSLAVWANLTSIVYGASIQETAQLGKARILVGAREIVEKAPVRIEVIGGVLNDECRLLYV